MHNILEHRNEERKKAIQLSIEYVKKLEAEIDHFTCVLYGSYARGDFNVGSDIDILIISDHLPSDMLKRMEFLYKYVRGGIEPKGYTKSEFLNMLSLKNPLAIDALENGEVISDDGFWGKMREEYKVLRKELGR